MSPNLHVTAFLLFLSRKVSCRLKRICMLLSRAKALLLYVTLKGVVMEDQ